jgi:hypothetical protein
VGGGDQARMQGESNSCSDFLAKNTTKSMIINQLSEAPSEGIKHFLAYMYINWD